MNDTIIDNDSGSHTISAQEMDGVRTARVLSFFADYIIVGLLCIPFIILVAILGLPTFGIAWALFPFIPGLVAIAYVGLTMGGEKQATLGMRFFGIQVKKLDGQKIDPLLACLHGLLFWAIHTIAVIIPLFVTFFSSRKRLLHDILLGTYVVRV